MKRILSGNEAIARGAWEAGVRVAAAYPGTPATEILEELSPAPGVYCRVVDEREGRARRRGGRGDRRRRALATMKHVGVNVAADSLFYASYTGVEAAWSSCPPTTRRCTRSQNEQDNRHYAAFARMPVPRAVRQPGVQGLHTRGVRHLRAVRHAGHAAHDDAHLPLLHARSSSGERVDVPPTPDEVRRATRRST